MKIPHLLLASSLAVLLAACSKEEPAPLPAPAAPPAPAVSAPVAPPAAEPVAAAPVQATEAPPAAPAAAPAETQAPRASDPALGKSVYGRNCAVCHSAGVAGSPKPGDKAEWGPRIAQGVDVLYEHAIKGFTGKKGMMPPRGGAGSLSDDEVRAAVDYLVSEAQ